MKVFTWLVGAMMLSLTMAGFEPPQPPSNTCANVRCTSGTVCRMVLRCQICAELQPRCLGPEDIGQDPDADCKRQRYLESLFFDTGASTYVHLKCRPLEVGRCPDGYVCVDIPDGEGVCCTGKPDPNAEKPGKCPQGELSVCGGIFCDKDQDCPGDQKCCPGCGNLCTNPVAEGTCGQSVCNEDETCTIVYPRCPKGLYCILALRPTPVCLPRWCKDCERKGMCDRQGQRAHCPGEDPPDQCGGCPRGEVCIDTGIRCITTPCPTFQCVPDNKCGGCPPGKRCQESRPSCHSSGCGPTFSCVDDVISIPDSCDLVQCSKGEKCVVGPSFCEGNICTADVVARCVPIESDPEQDPQKCKGLLSLVGCLLQGLLRTLG